MRRRGVYFIIRGIPKFACGEFHHEVISLVLCGEFHRDSDFTAKLGEALRLPSVNIIVKMSACHLELVETRRVTARGQISRIYVAYI